MDQIMYHNCSAAIPMTPSWLIKTDHWLHGTNRKSVCQLEMEENDARQQIIICKVTDST